MTLYVRRSPHDKSSAKRQNFAFNELKELLKAGDEFEWDLFEIPGSPTGALGLVQFEPTSLKDAVDGNGDGKIDLFDPEDAIPSLAHYLVTRGWDSDLENQHRAIYAYYGGNFKADKHKYYMRAVLKYADAFCAYVRDREIEAACCHRTRSQPKPVFLK